MKMSDTAHDLSAENVLRSFPQVLSEDIDMYALGSAIAELVERHFISIKSLLIYARIDELPENLLDILAYDFKVDWWDADYSVEEKRQILKDSWDVHRHLGTKSAVEKSISAIYPNPVVKEWFEYGGDPYHFRIELEVSGESVNPVKHQRVIDRIEYYKNVRSVLDAVEYAAGCAAQSYCVSAYSGSEIESGATAYIY